MLFMKGTGTAYCVDGDSCFCCFEYQVEQTTLLKHLECFTAIRFFYHLDRPNSSFGVDVSIPVADQEKMWQWISTWNT